MNQLPTNVQNTSGHSLELFHMNTSPLNVQKGGQSFQFTISIFSMFGISFRHHTRRNYSMNSYVQRCCHATRFIQLQSAFCNARFHHSEGLTKPYKKSPDTYMKSIMQITQTNE